MSDNKINILGSTWSIVERTEAEDSRLEGCDGYADWTKRLIVIEREMKGNLGDMEAYIRKVKRHEIVHAFLVEAGLLNSSSYADAWAANEEMVDWIARIGPKIYNAWVEAGALLSEDYMTEAPEKKHPPTWFEKAYRENADAAVKRLLEEARNAVEHPCQFCGGKESAMVTWKGAPVELRKIEPQPTVNLANRRKDAAYVAPFMALAIETDDGVDYFAVKHCPICGKYLDATMR